MPGTARYLAQQARCGPALPPARAGATIHPRTRKFTPRTDWGERPAHRGTGSRLQCSAMPTFALLLGLALAATLQTPQGPLRARLSPVPVDATLMESITGLGTATATLSGTTLAVDGTYQGLKSPATTVKVFDSPKPGLRGPLVGEFAAGGGTTGTFKGTLTLTREQAAAFGRGLLYVQVQSEKAPDGNLWGWLMAPKGRR